MLGRELPNEPGDDFVEVTLATLSRGGGWGQEGIRSPGGGDGPQGGMYPETGGFRPVP